MLDETVLVTGGSGFIGRRVVAALADAGIAVRALVHRNVPEGGLPDGVETVEGSVLDSESLARACDGVGAVVHLVAVVRESGDRTFHRVNVEGARNVLAAASAEGVERFVYASTIGATSDPEIPYLHSRWTAEQDVANSGLAHTIVRFSVGFGPGDEFFNVLAAQAKLFPLVPVAGTGANLFQPIAADDAARCLLEALRRDDTVGRTIEAGGPAQYTYDELVDLIADTLGVRIAKVHVPLPLMRPAAALMEALAPRPPVTAEQLKMIAIDNVTEIDCVERNLGFAPRPLEGNLDYLRDVRLRDALKINLGFMPARVRDH
jgi:NADH dehydrogenase